MQTAIEIKGIHKHLGKRHVLKDVSFTTYTGEVFGFLGPNGAGKTTTIKMIVGLLRVEEGSISICGQDVEKHFEEAMKNVGGIVENPETYKYMSGMANLRLYARMRGGVTQERIDEVVELVGLTNRIHEKVKRYSLGMKQRLGLAQALLHHPKVLILDEPTNGLDPAGIKQLRDILRHLAHEEGVCVLVSSHLMSEMELMCDRVGIIVNGEIRAVKTIDEMMALSANEYLEYRYRLRNAEAAQKILSAMEGITVEALDEQTLTVSYNKSLGEEYLDTLNRELVLGGVSILTVAPAENRHLEDTFLELTQEGGDQIV